MWAAMASNKNHNADVELDPVNWPDFEGANGNLSCGIRVILASSSSESFMDTLVPTKRQTEEIYIKQL